MSKIAVVGSQNVGKTTFINDFIKTFPMYEKADTSYRELAKGDPRVKLNKDGDEEGQRLIRDALCDEVMKYPKGSNVIFDRSIYDNLIYSIWLNCKDSENVSNLFIEKSKIIAKETAKLYDIIFFIPLLDNHPIAIVPDNQRDTDPVFREEIDHLFKALFKTYAEHRGDFFDFEDCPAVIEIFGNQEERIAITKLYINTDNGQPL